MNEVAYERNSRTQGLEVCLKITVKVRRKRKLRKQLYCASGFGERVLIGHPTSDFQYTTASPLFCELVSA